ncbi:MAG: cupredoxin domain-containing protein [Thermoplasmata archaeon]
MVGMKISVRPNGRKLFAKLLLAYFLFMLALPFAVSIASAAHDPSHKVVEIDIAARNYAYDPERIIVREGDHVRFKVRTVDVAHGFFLDGYDINEEIFPGEEIVIDFIADKVGKFSIRCSVTCGPFHPYMKGELIVEGEFGNSPFLGSLVLTIVVAGLTIAYVQRKE